MVYKLRFSNNAKLDELRAYSYYEDISLELAKRFMSNLDSCYDKITFYPQHYGYCDFKKEYRDYSMPSFPLQIVYKIQDDIVFIVRVHHYSKNPDVKFC